MTSLQAKVQRFRVCQLKHAPASANDNIFMKIVFRVSPQTKSIIFGSTKHKAVIETAKYSIFKGELLNQSFHDALSITALLCCKQKFRDLVCVN